MGVKPQMNFLKRINWTIGLFVTLTPLVAIIGTTVIIMHGHVVSTTIYFSLILALLTGLSVTGGYHRLFAHKAYHTIWPVRLLFLLFAASGFEGSALEWCTDHRSHHRYTDTDKDPYGVDKGFWHAHMGWLFFLDTSKRDFTNVEDLMKDPLIRFQHRFFVPLAFFMGFIMPMALAACWGDIWGGLFIAGALRIAFLQQMTFCINSVCHWFGKTSYSTTQSARDNWFAAFFTFGEGFHSFHHQFANDYRNGVRAYDFDPTKWLIRSLAFLGLAKDLRTVSKEQIIRYRIRAEENKMLQQVKCYSEEHFIQPLRDRILQMAAYIEKLEKDYQILKSKKMEHFQVEMTKYHLRLKVQKRRLRRAHSELKTTLALWGQLMRGRTQTVSV